MTRQPFYPFRSEQAKAEYESFCRERARAWPVPSETMMIETASGRTFVRASGRLTDPPLVLLPGARSGSLMWSQYSRAVTMPGCGTGYLPLASAISGAGESMVNLSTSGAISCSQFSI